MNLFSSSVKVLRRVGWTAAQANSPIRHPRFISSTRILLEKKTIVVPSMGDSITEGTIVEWTVQVGQAVKTDDVVALVETDKVTVEIKAQVDGVLTQQFGAVDETIEVGGPLYEVETEGLASASDAASKDTLAAAPAKSPTKEPASADNAASNDLTAPSASTSKDNIAITTESSSSLASREPSIHFLGKDGWAVRKAGVEEQASLAQQQAAAANTGPGKPHGVTVIQDDKVCHPMYGRPPFTDEEMEALLWGGANLVTDWKIKN
ncbi:hypothetical protein MPSEU_000576700 [Mayamaea pseudoterrestris]|nr:hypothetical protein MPSEU_000576700 [Mayamaea pseudoterrestris]